MHKLTRLISAALAATLVTVSFAGTAAARPADRNRHRGKPPIMVIGPVMPAAPARRAEPRRHDNTGAVVAAALTTAIATAIILNSRDRHHRRIVPLRRFDDRSCRELRRDCRRGFDRACVKFVRRCEDRR